MESDVMKEKVERLCSFLNLTQDAYDLRKIRSEDDLVSETLKLFNENPRLFRSFMFRAFDKRVRLAFARLYQIEGFEETERIDRLIPKNETNGVLSSLAEESGLIFPRLVLTNASLAVQTLLFVVPLITVGMIFFRSFEYYAALGVWMIMLALFAIFLPILIVNFFFPKFFLPSELDRIHTYRDLINDLVLMNRSSFYEKDYEYTSIELKTLIGLI